MDISAKPYNCAGPNTFDLRSDHGLKVGVGKADDKHLPDFFFESPFMGKGRDPQRRSKHQSETDEVSSDVEKMSHILTHMHHGVCKILFALLSIIGSFCIKVSCEEKNPTEIKPYEPHLVEVEPTFVAPIDSKGNFGLLPYKIRRPRWGKTLSVGASTFIAKDYITEVGVPGATTAMPYGDVYKTNMPMIEAQVVVKRNLGIGSIGIEVGGGYQRNNSYASVDNGGSPLSVDQSLDIILIRVGLIYSLDTLFREPYLVPYFSGGAYSIIHYEDGSPTAESPNGNTQAAPYFSFGAMAQLDWIDRAAARNAYEGTGLESTYVYVEGRLLVASNNSHDRKFDSGLTANAGVRLEF